MNVKKWIRIYYTKVTNSIAFYPAIIAFGFLLLSWTMLTIDFSLWGKELKTDLNWLSLKDTSTARSIISTVAGAIISITVFSFSMVMIVLNQAASQMSNRVLSSMIENRFQQIILGFYIGTIVYALFLLSTIREIDSGIQVPALSIYLLILLTVIDIFLFIYFLNYVTETVKYETVINRVKNQALETIHKNYLADNSQKPSWHHLSSVTLKTEEANYFQSYNEKKILEIAIKNNLYIEFLYKPSTFLLKNTEFIKVYNVTQIHENCLTDILKAADFYNGQPIAINASYGFTQLSEIAIKALSPGINDPGTAVIALHALADLFANILYINHPSIKTDNDSEIRIYIPNFTFKELFKKCINPIWNYGKNDQYIQNELLHMLDQLKKLDTKYLYTEIFNKMNIKVNSHLNN